MGAPDILRLLTARGLTVRPLPGGQLQVSPRSALTDELRALIRDHKAELLDALAGDEDRLPDANAEARKQRVLAMLAERPGVRYAVLTDTEADPEDVILVLAIRGVTTWELRIPRAKYDPFLLLELIERHGGAMH
jgi:hypothetical protein